MILTPHAIVGVTLVNMFPNNLVLGFGLAFASHYILDMIPHTDYDISGLFDEDEKTIRSVFKHTKAALQFLFIVFDFVFAIYLSLLFFVRDENSLIVTLVGLIGALLPDFLRLLYYKYNPQLRKFLHIHVAHHDEIQNHVTDDKNAKLWGALYQFLVPILFLVIYLIIKI